MPVKADHIAASTASDPVLQQVLRRVRHGWGDRCPDKGLEPFYVRKNELSTNSGCISWGNRVVIPVRGEKQLIEDLLTAHPGVIRWKIWRGATYGGQGWIQKLKIRSSHAKYVTRRDVDHLLKRHDVPGRTNHDDDGDLPDSAMPAEKNLVPSTAEVEQASDVTKETSPEAGIPPLDLRSDLRSSSTWRTL